MGGGGREGGGEELEVYAVSLAWFNFDLCSCTCGGGGGGVGVGGGGGGTKVKEWKER